MADATSWQRDATGIGRKAHSSRGSKLCVAPNKRRDGDSSAESESGRIYAEAEQRVREASMFGKLSNRRHRKWVNDRILRELATPLDAIEIGELFTPPPWGVQGKLSPFERITDFGASATDIAAWEPFANNVDMDWQTKALQQSRTSLKKVGDISHREAAMLAWRKVEHHARHVLKRNSSSPLLLAYEGMLQAYLQELEKEKVVKDLILDVDAPYNRLLLHGLSQFYGLVTRSVDSREATGTTQSMSTTKKVHIRKRQSCMEQSVLSSNAHLSLYVFLQGLQQCQIAAVA